MDVRNAADDEVQHSVTKRGEEDIVVTDRHFDVHLRSIFEKRDAGYRQQQIRNTRRCTDAQISDAAMGDVTYFTDDVLHGQAKRMRA